MLVIALTCSIVSWRRSNSIDLCSVWSKRSWCGIDVLCASARIYSGNPPLLFPTQGNFVAGKSGGKEGRSWTQTSLGIPRYDYGPFHIHNDLFINYLQLRSSFQSLCSGLRGPADLPSTCMLLWVPSLDLRYLDISVRCHPYTAVRRTFNGNWFIVFLSVSDFTVESYGLMASSAVTGQSFARGAPCFLPGDAQISTNGQLENICGILCLVSVQFYKNGEPSVFSLLPTG